VRDRENDLLMIREQYGAVQRLYTQRLADLNQKVQVLTKALKSEQSRRRLEAEGYEVDIRNLKMEVNRLSDSFHALNRTANEGRTCYDRNESSSDKYNRIKRAYHAKSENQLFEERIMEEHDEDDDDDDKVGEEAASRFYSGGGGGGGGVNHHGTKHHGTNRPVKFDYSIHVYNEKDENYESSSKLIERTRKMEGSMYEDSNLVVTSQPPKAHSLTPPGVAQRDNKKMTNKMTNKDNSVIKNVTNTAMRPATTSGVKQQQPPTLDNTDNKWFQAQKQLYRQQQQHQETIDKESARIENELFEKQHPPSLFRDDDHGAAQEEDNHGGKDHDANKLSATDPARHDMFKHQEDMHRIRNKRVDYVSECGASDEILGADQFVRFDSDAAEGINLAETIDLTHAKQSKKKPTAVGPKKSDLGRKKKKIASRQREWA